MNIFRKLRSFGNLKIPIFIYRQQCNGEVVGAQPVDDTVIQSTIARMVDGVISESNQIAQVRITAERCPI